ncbi:General transcription factor II-I repeat domain-containing protein 2 [Thelohanellus kitauei]|uniref:General transcription factor II-I repeat domain-containing protein 2 n=1 Tax=Thelohanellus kitauei TaxID=669202 RepID=A0A0C2MMW4_THEKT|nr:General transcription factor II-I repeat domain-containing protein 2 [Thelohanellus kitauei]
MFPVIWKVSFQKKFKPFVAFSIASDECIDITDTAQFAVFILVLDNDINITEKFVELISMKVTTTADDVYQRLVDSLDKVGVDWKEAVSLVTDGAPEMIGRKIRMATNLKEKHNNRI